MDLVEQTAQDAKYRILVKERDDVGFTACATRFDLLSRSIEQKTVLGGVRTE